MLVYVIRAAEESFEQFALGSDGNHLAARVHQFIGIVRKQIEIQAVLGELRFIEAAASGLNRDIARR